jgi:hypothetical protein
MYVAELMRKMGQDCYIFLLKTDLQKQWSIAFHPLLALAKLVSWGLLNDIVTKNDYFDEYPTCQIPV